MIKNVSKSIKNTIFFTTFIAATIAGCHESPRTAHNPTPNGNVPVCATNQDFITQIINNCTPVSEIFNKTPAASCTCQKSPAVIVEKYYHNSGCQGDPFCTATFTYNPSPFILNDPSSSVFENNCSQLIDQNSDFVKATIESC